MEPGQLIRRAREAAGLSKRELARRSATSAAAIVEYESGRRDPNARTLVRIVGAAGATLELVSRREVDLARSGAEAAGEGSATRADRLDDERQGRILREVLHLAEHLPQRRAPRRIPYPRFPS